MAGVISHDPAAPEVMTSEEAADFLRMNRAHLVALARAGTVPAHQVSRHWRFLRSELLAWVAAQGPGAPATRA